MRKVYTDKDGNIQEAFDRFEFEQQIMGCWNVTTDIQTVTEYLLDAPLEKGREDKIANMLMGIEALYDAKFNKLFRQFEQLIREHSKILDADSESEWIDVMAQDGLKRWMEDERKNPFPNIEINEEKP